MAKDKDPFQGPSTESRQAGYETSGVSIKGLAIFVVCLVVLAAIIHAGVWFLFGDYVNFDEAQNRPHSAVSDQQYVTDFNQQHRSDFPMPKQTIPPPPRLQPTPGLDQQNNPDADLQTMYAGEDAVFRRMGWTLDERTHVQVAIPDSVIQAVISDETTRQKQQNQ